MLFGIQAVQQTICVPMLIESDSTEVVELSLKRKGSMIEISCRIEEIQASLENQNMSSIQSVPRRCNAIAHSPTKVALEFENPALWMEDFPA